MAVLCASLRGRAVSGRRAIKRQKASAGRRTRRSSELGAADVADGEGEEMAVACELDQRRNPVGGRRTGRTGERGTRSEETKNEEKQERASRSARGPLWEDPKLC